MIHKAKRDEKLLFRSMGKSFRITAVATTDEEANEHMRKHDDDAVIASFGPFVFMANKYDAGHV
jgi:hypothetical protein